jgi:hypothetical protein
MSGSEVDECGFEWDKARSLGDPQVHGPPSHLGKGIRRPRIGIRQIEHWLAISSSFSILRMRSILAGSKPGAVTRRRRDMRAKQEQLWRRHPAAESTSFLFLPCQSQPDRTFYSCHSLCHPAPSFRNRMSNTISLAIESPRCSTRRSRRYLHGMQRRYHLA